MTATATGVLSAADMADPELGDFKIIGQPVRSTVKVVRRRHGSGISPTSRMRFRDRGSKRASRPPPTVWEQFQMTCSVGVELVDELKRRGTRSDAATSTDATQA